jgi:hypothetical protein
MILLADTELRRLKLAGLANTQRNRGIRETESGHLVALTSTFFGFFSLLFIEDPALVARRHARDPSMSCRGTTPSMDARAPRARRNHTTNSAPRRHFRGKPMTQAPNRIHVLIQKTNLANSKLISTSLN